MLVESVQNRVIATLKKSCILYENAYLLREHPGCFTHKQFDNFKLAGNLNLMLLEGEVLRPYHTQNSMYNAHYVVPLCLRVAWLARA